MNVPRPPSTARQSSAWTRSASYVSRSIGITPRKIREDRILHDALASGGDARRLCDQFGLSIKAARRYTTLVEHADLAQATSLVPAAHCDSDRSVPSGARFEPVFRGTGNALAGSDGCATRSCALAVE